jgi:hypothetical protein
VSQELAVNPPELGDIKPEERNGREVVRGDSCKDTASLVASRDGKQKVRESYSALYRTEQAADNKNDEGGEANGTNTEPSELHVMFGLDLTVSMLDPSMTDHVAPGDLSLFFSIMEWQSH